MLFTRDTITQGSWWVRVLVLQWTCPDTVREARDHKTRDLLYTALT